MMKQDKLKELLTSYKWRENFNIWTFRENAMMIKVFTSPGITQYLPYDLECSFNDEIILKTKNENFGDFILKVNYENRLPKLLLFSRTIKEKYHQLEAFEGLSSEEKFAIEVEIRKLKDEFHSKEGDLHDRIFHLQKTTRPDKKLLISEYESFLNRAKTEIEMLETIINSTIEVTEDFQTYFEMIRADVKKLKDVIQNI